MDLLLRLSTGSHQAGTGYGCAMNIVSWENGDRLISDFPVCSDRFLARYVQIVNDTFCAHAVSNNDEDRKRFRKASHRLCASCSMQVLGLAHRTVGTAIEDEDKRWEVYYGLLGRYYHMDASRGMMKYVWKAHAEMHIPHRIRRLTMSSIPNGTYTRGQLEMSWMFHAHEFITNFYEVAGIEERPAPEPVVIEAAYNKMLVRA